MLRREMVVEVLVGDCKKVVRRSFVEVEEVTLQNRRKIHLDNEAGKQRFRHRLQRMMALLVFSL